MIYRFKLRRKSSQHKPTLEVPAGTPIYGYDPDRRGWVLIGGES